MCHTEYYTPLPYKAGGSDKETITSSYGVGRGFYDGKPISAGELLEYLRQQKSIPTGRVDALTAAINAGLRAVGAAVYQNGLERQSKAPSWISRGGHTHGESTVSRVMGTHLPTFSVGRAAAVLL